MQHLDLILTLTGGLAAALLLGYGAFRIGLSPVVGYLLAGIAVGPRTPGFVAHEGLANELAEIGVILLMFGVGLQFHLKELLAVRRVAIPGAVGQIAVATALGALAVHFWGQSLSVGIVFGLALSVASTVVLVRVLSDQRDLHTPTGRVAIGWLVVEDLFTVFALVALPLVFKQRRSDSLAVSLSWAALKLGALVAATLLFGRRAIPTLFAHAAKTRSRELFTLTVLVTALGIAVASAKLFGASMALGAFLAGMVVGQSEFSARAASDALPMRDAFAVLFFVSVGMLFDPAQLLRAPAQIVVTLGIVLVAKPVAAWLIVRMLGKPDQVALPVAAALAQIGEFSFVLASTAQGLGVMSGELTSTLVAVSIVSIALNPALYRRLRALGNRRRAGAPRPATDEAAPIVTAPDQDLAVVVGYGPTGQMVTEILRDNGMAAAVVELNLDTTRVLRDGGIDGVYGDATRPEVLEQAGLKHAAALFLTALDFEGVEDVVRVAKELNPNIRIYARSHYLREAPRLRRAGAQTVVSAEGEVALAMAMALLEDLGASPEQIDDERHRMSSRLLQS